MRKAKKNTGSVRVADLYTAAGETLAGTPWQAYPRPQLKRDSYVNLNGTWSFAVKTPGDTREDRVGSIRVPFCPESLLSGVHYHFPEGSQLIYRRSFTLPKGFQNDRVLLHIGAADQKAEVYVNQVKVGTHAGGYESFCIDITEHLKEINELMVCCTDDLRDRSMPYGKQVMDRGGMWYTPVSGIWQTVWLESVPEHYVNSMDIQVSLTAATIRVEPPMDGTVTLADGSIFPLRNGVALVTPGEAKLWSPEEPYLYTFTLKAGKDELRSYFALRTIESRVVNGIPRLCLNGQPYFFHGLLDQGYWPDGLFTSATPECYAQDILAMKRLGFNMLRKHIKVEPEQFYYDCDRLGMVVFQDMVNNDDYRFFRDTALPTVGIQRLPDKNLHRDEAARRAFLDGMEAAVRQLKNHPCILFWTIFNEGWGQFDGTNVYHRLKALDSSRIIDTTSGWFRGSETDVDSRHIYFGPWRLKASGKPLVLSEFGGYAYGVAEHLFNPDKAYGYRTCRSREAFMDELEALYLEKVIPAVKKGLCAAVYTQVSDVEDEINGLLTYDRKVTKPDEKRMRAIAARLQKAMNEA